MPLIINKGTILFFEIRNYAMEQHHKKRKKERTEAVAWRCSIKKGVLRNFAKFTGNNCARVPFSIKKRDSGTGVFLQIL